MFCKLSNRQLLRDEANKLVLEPSKFLIGFKSIIIIEDAPYLNIQIVEKHSALLEVAGEDQQPVDVDHRALCRFNSRDDETYQKLIKRLYRMLKGKKTITAMNSCDFVEPLTLSGISLVDSKARV